MRFQPPVHEEDDDDEQDEKARVNSERPRTSDTIVAICENRK